MKKRREYEPIAWREGVVRYVDQTLLPHELHYAEATTYSELVDAIQRLAIRGAPLIGIAGAFALVLASREFEDDQAKFRSSAGTISEARPTAINLAYSVNRLLSRLPVTVPGADRTNLLLDEAQRLFKETVDADISIATNARPLFDTPSSVLTICNTGPLATGGYGTALGVIADAWERGMVTMVYVCETRPLLQGARLTMWELGQLGIPATLLHDSAAGALFLRGAIDRVITGADRIVANGDTANKVGTYVLASLAEKHGVPFYVAAPSSSIDPATARGEDIPIEVRSGAEVLSFAGTSIATAGARTFTPAFDVTPGDMLTAIVTEQGVFRKPYRFGAVRTTGRDKGTH